MASNEYHRWSHGDYMRWVVEWKKHPWQGEKQILKTEMDISPKQSHRVTHAKSAMRFNDNRVSLNEHQPGNSTGSSTRSMSLTVGLPEAVEVTFGGSTTVPNLEINDKTKYYDADVIEKYDIHGGLRYNSLNLNAASLVDTNWRSGATFAHIGLKSWFTYGRFYLNHDSISNYYSYYWA